MRNCIDMIIFILKNKIKIFCFIFLMLNLYISANESLYRANLYLETHNRVKFGTLFPLPTNPFYAKGNVEKLIYFEDPEDYPKRPSQIYEYNKQKQLISWSLQTYDYLIKTEYHYEGGRLIKKTEQKDNGNVKVLNNILYEYKNGLIKEKFTSDNLKNVFTQTIKQEDPSITYKTVRAPDDIVIEKYYFLDGLLMGIDKIRKLSLKLPHLDDIHLKDTFGYVGTNLDRYSQISIKKIKINGVDSTEYKDIIKEKYEYDSNGNFVSAYKDLYRDKHYIFEYNVEETDKEGNWTILNFKNNQGDYGKKIRIITYYE